MGSLTSISPSFSCETNNELQDKIDDLTDDLKSMNATLIRLTDKIENKLEFQDAKIDTQYSLFDEKIQRLEDKIDSKVEMIMLKINLP